MNSLRKWLPAALLLVALGAAGFANAATTPVKRSFDHLTTGFELEGKHLDTACESCHVNAVFRHTR